MEDRIRVTIEIDSADHAALSDIARDHEQSFDELATEALRARIARERDWEEAIQSGLADIAAGRTISHEEMLAGSAERRARWLAARER
jgi:predicted transcriptional regulator